MGALDVFPALHSGGARHEIPHIGLGGAPSSRRMHREHAPGTLSPGPVRFRVNRAPSERDNLASSRDRPLGADRADPFGSTSATWAECCERVKVSASACAHSRCFLDPFQCYDRMVTCVNSFVGGSGCRPSLKEWNSHRLVAAVLAHRYQSSWRKKAGRPTLTRRIRHPEHNLQHVMPEKRR